ncbi:MAG: hypothetical protein PHP98_02890 [Kiritimatiellae bacterium]|nr:hypothetical protein [Kiritimatiellia bacterium]
MAKIYTGIIAGVVCCAALGCFLAAQARRGGPDVPASGGAGEPERGRPAVTVSACGAGEPSAASGELWKTNAGISAEGLEGDAALPEQGGLPDCSDENAEKENGLEDEEYSPEEIAAFKEQFMRKRFGVVRRQGKWIPTIDGASNLVYITTGSLPPGRVGEVYEAQFSAASGCPPYAWKIVSGELPQSFLFDGYSGKLAGVPEEPVTARFFIEVTDSRGAKDMAEYALTFQPERPLAIATEILPAAVPGEDYFCQLQVSGGIPPYTWGAAGNIDGEIGALVIDVNNGQISGRIADNAPQIDVPLVFWLSDAQVSVSKELTFRVRSAPSILNAPQSPLYESELFEFVFQAAGGREPYLWSAGGLLPPGLEFSADGLLSGRPSEPGLYENSVQIQDADGRLAAVTFALEVLSRAPALSDFRALLSRNSVALKWELPPADGKIGVRIVRNSARKPLTPADGKAVYYGPGTSCLDGDVGRGRYYYAAFLEENGTTVTSAAPPALCVTLPPETDPFADKVASSKLLHPNAFRSSELPRIVLGAPRGTGLASGSADVVSLGAAINNDNGGSAPYGGSIILEFVDNVVWDGPGADFTIFENVFYICNDAGVLDPETRFMEPAVVAVSQDGVNWRQFPIDFSPRYYPGSGKLNVRHPYCYNSGFAGVNPVMSNGCDPDPTDPALSGGDSFDISALGLDWIRYVLIQSVGSRWLADKDGELVCHNEETGAADRNNNKSGFDLDAVTAIWMQKVAASDGAGGGSQ